jgi:LysM repeat protein
METENPQPQTGGLKLMTVFIVVLALHVVVIGGISVYHVLKRGSSDVTNNDAPKDNTTETADTGKPEGGDATAQADQQGAPQQVTPTDSQVTSGGTPAPADPTTAHTQMVTPAPAPTPAPETTAHDTKVTPAPTPAPVQGDTPVTTAEVTVKPGESLYRIAKQNHTTVDAIKKLNGLTTDNLKVGQKLKVAAKGSAAPSTAVVQTSGQAATPAPAAATTPKPAFKTTVAPTASAPAAAAGSTVYTVSKGDTLTKIARQYKTTAAAIMSANNLSDPHKLSIGAKLKIPTQQAATQSESTSSRAASAKPAPAASSDLVMADHSAAH